MAIKDEKPVWNECQDYVLELIKGITKETKEEQTEKMYRDPIYRSTIDLITQLLFTIKTDERFIEEEKKLKAEVLHHDMKANLKRYGVDID